ncbi:MAG: molybdenum cofactor biosynthesis protein MoaE [Gallionella sp.]
MATIRVQHEDFDAGHEIAALRADNPAIGAIACFVGLVRDVNEGDSITGMTLEHYPGMNENALAAIAEEAAQRWHIYTSLIIHRVGLMRPTDQIVLVAVASSHRGDAFPACEFIMDYLKQRAPFWKQENTPHGQRWVNARCADAFAEQRWNTPPSGNIVAQETA